jgi:hypothetical protein
MTPSQYVFPELDATDDVHHIPPRVLPRGTPRSSGFHRLEDSNYYPDHAAGAKSQPARKMVNCGVIDYVTSRPWFYRRGLTHYFQPFRSQVIGEKGAVSAALTLRILGTTKRSSLCGWPMAMMRHLALKSAGSRSHVKVS